MAEFFIYETNECFKVFPSTKEYKENIWGECEVSYSNIKDKEGIIGIKFYKIFNTVDKRFDFNFYAKGEFHHKDGFGPVFSIDWEISDKNSRDIFQIKGGDWTNHWSNESIASALQSFLNLLYQFDSLEDFNKYNEFADDVSWDRKDLKDKILMLAEIIKLFEKYSKVNPSSYCLRDLDKKIKQHIDSLFNHI